MNKIYRLSDALPFDQNGLPLTVNKRHGNGIPALFKFYPKPLHAPMFIAFGFSEV